MPRTARMKSESGIYHVILRGNNQQRIFEDDQDYQTFMQILSNQRKQCGFVLYSWCLMPNHIHILLKEKDTPLSTIFRKIGSSFVWWYNRKYKRVGHLFQDRFLSEVVEDQFYFQTVIRYIHLNPVKGKICKAPEKYIYSSYNWMFNSGRYSDTDLIFKLFPKKEFEEYHKEKNDDLCLDYDHPARRIITDEIAEKIIKLYFKCERIALVNSLPEDERNRAVQKLLRIGSSEKQINRLTGVSVGMIEKIKNQETIPATGTVTPEPSPLH